jgi:8-oxo-dGTP diphosphatase
MINVVCFIIQRANHNTYLIARHTGHKILPNKWEFFGGKVEEGKSLEDALIREVSEEIGAEVVITGYQVPIIRAYPHETIKLWPLYCKLGDNSPEPCANTKDHLELKWVKSEEMHHYDFVKAENSIISRL